MANVVAGSYADALFELGKQEAKVEQYKLDLLEMKQIYEMSDELRKVLESPRIAKADKKAILRRLYAGEPFVMNFLQVLADRDRYRLFPDIVDAYVEKANELLGIEVAECTSAVALDEKSAAALQKALEKKLNKRVEMKFRIDPEIIAGIRVRINDEVMDNTILHRLNELKTRLES
ncbi:MAG: ATP synthase F1 subunit delta [Erysipelotrichaceae bacterium]|nr:ATP synthase F1 subunit delta [Erysipelotrichaceae bacterium]